METLASKTTTCLLFVFDVCGARIASSALTSHLALQPGKLRSDCVGELETIAVCRWYHRREGESCAVVKDGSQAELKKSCRPASIRTRHGNSLRPMALTSLLDIPPELISSILLYLSPHAILACRRTCRTLYDLCGESHWRYLIQMERSAVSDDMGPGLCYPDRLRILEKREEAWEMLNFRKSIQVDVPFESTGIYDFTGGAFLLGTRLYSTSRRPTVGYSYVSLPSLSDVQDQKLEWTALNLGLQILDVGLAVHEHDLIAALTACVVSCSSF